MRLLFFLAVLLGATITSPAAAEPGWLPGWTFYRTTVTHSAVDPGLDAAVAAALATYGSVSAIEDGGTGDDIVIGWGLHEGASSAMPVLDGETITGCVIEMDPLWYGYDEPLRSNLVLHEVGHCLGLVHPGVRPSVMEAPIDGWAEYDAVSIAGLYPVAEECPYDSGWNMVGGGGLWPLPECVRAVYGWDGEGWLRWLRGAPDYVNTLGAPDPELGYWAWVAL